MCLHMHTHVYVYICSVYIYISIHYYSHKYTHTYIHACTNIVGDPKLLRYIEVTCYNRAHLTRNHDPPPTLAIHCAS